MKPIRKWFHRHKFSITAPFAAPSGFFWPPMWACPCGKMRDVMAMDDWGL